MGVHRALYAMSQMDNGGMERAMETCDHHSLRRLGQTLNLHLSFYHLYHLYHLFYLVRHPFIQSALSRDGSPTLIPSVVRIRDHIHIHDDLDPRRHVPKVHDRSRGGADRELAHPFLESSGHLHRDRRGLHGVDHLAPF